MAHFNYEELYTATGRFLKRKLHERHMTQRDFAKARYVDVKTVSRWINGEVHSLDIIVEIARYFGVSVGDVLSDEDDIPFLLQKNKRFRKDISRPFGISYFMLQ